MDNTNKAGSFFIRIFFIFSLINFVFCSKPPVKVGVFHNITGTISISGKSMVDATLFAIEEVNKNGGVLGGRKVKAVVIDANPEITPYEKGLSRLIEKENIDFIFGCWTSSCRKEAKKVVEKYNKILFYPVQYEGLESSKNIIYTGAIPNQQIIPSLHWFIKNKGRRLYLIGSDYVFPRLANQIIRDMVGFHGGKIVGERYISLGTSEFSGIINEIRHLKPDVILNTINGDSNKYFFHEFYNAGFTSDRFPVVSYSIAEDELRQMNIPEIEGQYAVWNYFQSLDNPLNKKFVSEFKKVYGEDRVLDDPMLSAYISVKLWAKAMNELDEYTFDQFRNAIQKQSMNTPAGIVSVDFENQHTWKKVYIGKINPQGQFDIVWDSLSPVRPLSFPRFRNIDEWEHIVNQWE